MALEVWEAEGVAGEIWGGFCLEPGPLPVVGTVPAQWMTRTGEALGR